MDIGKHCRRGMKSDALPEHRPDMQNWPQQCNFTAQHSIRHRLSSLGVCYLEQNVQRREIMKYLTNSVWSSWLSQRGFRAGRAKKELRASHFPWVPEKPKQRNTKIKKSTAISIRKELRGRWELGRWGIISPPNVLSKEKYLPALFTKFQLCG